jgi:hypothetical protein
MYPSKVSRFFNVVTLLLSAVFFDGIRVTCAAHAVSDKIFIRVGGCNAPKYLKEFPELFDKNFIKKHPIILFINNNNIFFREDNHRTFDGYHQTFNEQ